MKIKSVTKYVGIPTLIIAVFWLFILILGPFTGISLNSMLSDAVRRFGMNAIMTLAMVPAIQSGTGPNFALPVGLICGLFAMVCAIEFGFLGLNWLLASFVMAASFAAALGFVYGKMMNAVKGSEMTIATYTGFSISAFMCLVWLMVPFKNPKMGWFMGTGLRETIQLKEVGGAQILSGFLEFSAFGVNIPTGNLAVFAAFCLLVWLFFRSRAGIAISAGGISPMFARSSGIDTDKARVMANMLSTMLGALGIIVYAQTYGFIQLYNAPRDMAFPAVAAVLVGGATARRAKISHVVIGTLLFQGLLATAPAVANRIFEGTDLSEIMRMIVQNGIILYALTQVKGGDQ